MTLVSDETKQMIFESQGWLCWHCSKPLLMGHFQLAHLIPQKMIEKYGEEVIHHIMNMVGVDDTARCNNAVSIANQPQQIEALVAEIRADIEAKRKIYGPVRS